MTFPFHFPWLWWDNGKENGNYYLGFRQWQAYDTLVQCQLCGNQLHDEPVPLILNPEVPRLYNHQS